MSCKYFASTTAPCCRSSITDGKLIGIVTVDDVLDIAEQSTTTEEFQRFGGMEDARRRLYLKVSLLSMVKQARDVALRAVPRRNVDRVGDGLL